MSGSRFATTDRESPQATPSGSSSPSSVWRARVRARGGLASASPSRSAWSKRTPERSGSIEARATGPALCSRCRGALVSVNTVRAEPTGARLLVVDDEPSMVRTLRTNLRGHGFQVETAETAGGAAPRYQGTQAALVGVHRN